MLRKHWTVRYVVNRCRLWLTEKMWPNHPWWTLDSIRIIERALRPSDVGIEFGSGRSTLWMADRVKRIHSVEDDELWFQRVSGLLKDRGVHNVEYSFAPTLAKYVEPLQSASAESLDFVIVDGSHREACALLAVDKLKAGGLIILDNANWYLPGATKSPNSIPPAHPCPSPEWQAFLEKVALWRTIRTSNGVTDTWILLKVGS